MQMKIEVLNKGDTVLNVWENSIAIQRKNGDVEIIQYELSANGIPRIKPDSILITKGDGSIRIVNDDSTFEIGTF